MPARRLDQTPESVGRFDVVGLDSDGTQNFVGHAGLSRQAYNGVASSIPIGLADMGPPLDRFGHELLVHCIGTVPLTDDEIERIGLFIDELEFEYAASQTVDSGQYVVHPHCVDEPETDTTPTRRRFSCGGFVLEAYRQIDIDLVKTETDALPLVTIETLRIAYRDPRQLRALAIPRARAALGLVGGGPWRIFLPRYLLHSLARTEVAIRSGVPYTPHPGDEFFPAQPTQPGSVPSNPPG